MVTPSGFSTSTCLPAAMAFWHHRLDLWIGQHRIVITIGGTRLVDRCHSVQQIRRGIADRVEFSISRFADSLKMRGLRDRAAAKDTYS